MPSKDDDNLDPVPSMRATRGDRASASKPRSAGARPAPSPNQSAASAVNQAKPANNWVSTVALAAVTVVAAGFIWQNIQLSAALEQAQAERDLAGQRITVLESMFDSSNDNMAENSEMVSAKLKWADSEIRKLWGVAYDRNRKNISTNSDSIKSVNASLKRVTSKVDGASASIKKLSADYGKLNTKVGRSGTDVSEALQRLTIAQESMSEIESTLASLSSKMAAIEKAQRAQSNAGSSSVAAMKEQLDSLEKWRITTNRELNRLRAASGG